MNLTGLTRNLIVSLLALTLWAGSSYAQAQGCDPNRPVTTVEEWTDRDRDCVNAGDYEQGIADLTKAIEIDPNYAIAYYNRGLTHYDLGNLDRTLENTQRALDLRYEQPELVYQLQGWTQFHLGHYDLAIAAFNNALAANPNFDQTYRGLGDFEQAVAYYHTIGVQPSGGGRSNMEYLLLVVVAIPARLRVRRHVVDKKGRIPIDPPRYVTLLEEAAPPVALFQPGVAVVVVAVDLPEAGFIHRAEFQRAHKLGTFPEVALGNQCPHRETVIWFQKLAVIFVRQQDVVLHHRFNRQIGGVTVIAVCDDILRARFDPEHFRKLDKGDPFPESVEFAPASDTVNIGGNHFCGQRQKFVPCPAHFVFNFAEHPKIPGLRVERRIWAIGKHREFLGEGLPRWQPAFASDFVFFLTTPEKIHDLPIPLLFSAPHYRQINPPNANRKLCVV